MLGKILLLALAVWLVLLLLRQYRRSIDSPRNPTPREPEDMVACAVCGVHLPRSESLLIHGAYYCCKDHSDKAAQ